MKKLLSLLVMLIVLFSTVGGAFADFNPGTYTVEMQAHNGPITVNVTFSADRMEEITFDANKESKQLGDIAIQMTVDEILSTQSLNVDTVAGATISSAVARAAVSQAVKDAGGDPAAMQTEKPVDSSVLPDENTQMLIIGGGAAGMAAAVEGADLGLDVLLVESLGILGGSSMRAGGIHGAETSVQKQYGQEYTKDMLYDFIAAELSDNLDPETLDLEYCKQAVTRWGGNIDWLVDMGVTFGEPYAGSPYHSDAGAERNGWRYIKAMREHMDEHGVDYRLNTRATSLIIEDGAVKGAVMQAPNGTSYNVYADSVVICTGGFLHNKELVAEYLPGFENGTTDVSIGCDGSGLLMALEAGAAVKAMDSAGMHGFACLHMGLSRSLTSPAHFGGIAVNAKGERFCNENASYADITAAARAQDACWMIMDDATFNTTSILTDISGNPDMYVIRDTLDELASELGIDPEGLKATAARYGEFVRNGVDEDFAKEKIALVGDFSKGPYYGVKTVIENHTSYGGLSIDNQARVLNEQGEPIEGLLAAGEVACFKTAGRCPLSETIDFGRIAARTVKAEIDAE